MKNYNRITYEERVKIELLNKLPRSRASGNYPQK